VIGNMMASGGRLSRAQSLPNLARYLLVLAVVSFASVLYSTPSEHHPDSHTSLLLLAPQKNDARLLPKRLNSNEIVPLRNESVKELAQQCVHAGQGGIYIKHFRKAGGTALKTAIFKEVCHRGIQAYSSELPFFNPETFEVMGTSIFITAMRNPVDRILSMYWFEGRWPRTCGKNCENEKVKNDTTKVADLGDWVQAIYDQSSWRNLKYKRHNGCGQWVSVENYYIRQLLGVDMASSRSVAKTTKHGRGFLNVTLTREHLHRAKEILASFDLVLIQEQMSEPSAMARMFHSITREGKSSEMVQVREGQERKNLFQTSSTADLMRLQELNALDLELYEYAVQLSAATVRRWMAQETERERIGNALSNRTDLVCNKPPLLLEEKDHAVTLGGPFCRAGSRSLYPNGCIQHSREGDL
jgi:hypothetical protein